MNEFVLDGSKMTNREEAHLYLKKELDFPAYYGMNLDALFDVLTDIGKPTLLKFINWHDLLAMGEYGKNMQNTILDADKENPYLTILIEE